MNPASAPDEAQLIAALRRGEGGAFETLVRQHGDALYRLAVRVLGNEAEARDAVQDGFISAYKEIKSFEARASLKTWLYRIVLNAALMRRRSRQRKNEVAIDELLPQIDEFRHEPDWNFTESAEDTVARGHLRQHIRAQIEPAGGLPYRFVAQGHRRIRHPRDGGDAGRQRGQREGPLAPGARSPEDPAGAALQG